MAFTDNPAHDERMDVDGFVRDGYTVVRGAFDADTAAACRKAILAQSLMPRFCGSSAIQAARCGSSAAIRVSASRNA